LKGEICFRLKEKCFNKSNVRAKVLEISGREGFFLNNLPLSCQESLVLIVKKE